MDVPVGLELKPSPVHGLGIFATTPILYGQFIGYDKGGVQSALWE